MSDTHAACMNFVNAQEIIPSIIAQYEERTAKLKVDVPQLEAIISKTWGKEDELKQLKSELAALDHKITAALTPKKDEQDGEENRPDKQEQSTKICLLNAQNSRTIDLPLLWNHDGIINQHLPVVRFVVFPAVRSGL